MSADETEALQTVAEGYHALGHNVIPFCFCKEGEKEAKKPLVSWKVWITQRQTKEEFNNLPWERAQGFGLVCGTRNDQGYYLAVVDYDTKDPKISEEVKTLGRKILSNLPITQMEKTRNNGLHYVYLSKQLAPTIKDYREETALELQGEGALIIMAPSEGYKQLNDNTPTIVNDIKETFLAAAIRSGVRIQQEKPVTGQDKNHPPGPFRIDQIIDVNLLKINGDELQGPHPFHGSDGDTNFTVNLKKNVWHCFRCDTGGGPLQLFAIKNDLLRCNQVGKGAIDPKMYKRLMKLAEAQGLVTKEDEKKKGSQAGRLVILALAQDAELFCDQYEKPFMRFFDLRYCDINDDSGYESAKNKNEEKKEIPEKLSETTQTSQYRNRYIICPIKSGRIKQWLAGLFWDAEGKAPGPVPSKLPNNLRVYAVHNGEKCISCGALAVTRELHDTKANNRKRFCDPCAKREIEFFQKNGCFNELSEHEEDF